MTTPTFEFSETELIAARSWLALVEREDVAQSLDAVLRSLDDAVTARGPVCWSSGRCCRFDWFGHRLYTTGLEGARAWRLMSRAAPPSTDTSLPILQWSPSDCRYHINNRCTAREARPVGCRVFFCERGAETWQQDIYEQVMSDLRSLHDALGATYRFAEWRWMLALLDAASADDLSD